MCVSLAYTEAFSYRKSWKEQGTMYAGDAREGPETLGIFINEKALEQYYYLQKPKHRKKQKQHMSALCVYY